MEITTTVKNKKDQKTGLAFYGVVKGSTAKVVGKGRGGYTASFTGYTPVFKAVISPMPQ